MTEKDPIELLRKCLKYEDTLDLLREKLGVDFRPGWTHACLDKFADEIEAQYMRLPVDAEGVPIRPEDEVVHIGDPQRHSRVVVAVSEENFYCSNNVLHPSRMFRHVKPDTVESLLEDMMRDIASEHVIYVPVDKQDGFGARLRDIRDNYAERIRKAME